MREDIFDKKSKRGTGRSAKDEPVAALDDIQPGRGFKIQEPKLPRRKSNTTTLERKVSWIKGKPQLKGQFFQQGAWRPGPPTTYVLDLLKPVDVQKLNKLQKLAFVGEDGPEVTIHEVKQVVGDRWICVVSVCDVFYQRQTTKST